MRRKMVEYVALVLGIGTLMLLAIEIGLGPAFAGAEKFMIFFKVFFIGIALALSVVVAWLIELIAIDNGASANIITLLNRVWIIWMVLVIVAFMALVLYTFFTVVQQARDVVKNQNDQKEKA